MTDTFTPGPWVVNPDSAQIDCSALCDCGCGGLLPVARVLWPTEQRSEDETFANGRLIAAAPELLAACARAAKWLVICDDPRSDKDLRAVEAAVRKARGK